MFWAFRLIRSCDDGEPDVVRTLLIAEADANNYGQLPTVVDDQTSTFVVRSDDDPGEAIIEHVRSWLHDVAPISGEADLSRLKMAIEVFVSAWKDFAADAPLTADDRRHGDAYAAVAMEVANCEEPDRGVLRAAFNWFARKADHFADEFVGAAGKATGAAAGIGVGATISGHLSDLIKAIGAVRQALGS